MAPIKDHDLRYKMANELHARPFPTLNAPTTACYLAIKAAENAASRDRDLDRQHLLDLLDRYGADHPAPGATHYYAKVGKVWLKWEQHTEFMTYTVFMEGLSNRAFNPTDFEFFPDEWLANAPGTRLTSALIRVAKAKTDEKTRTHLDDWFVAESLAVSRVLSNSATVAGDFRIDQAGHMRFAIFANPETGNQRIGRIVQRICEIETYKSMSMLGLVRARSMGKRMGELDHQLITLVAQMAGDEVASEDTLHELLIISTELENMSAQASYRISATKAYEALVTQRISVLREERFQGRQTFHEFMMRRFDPAMRTVAATETQLKSMADRALRAGGLLRTRVDVERQGQNQKLLESMDKRADLQLRLQKTVEGLSVVAISYYAINLVLYVLGPIPDLLGVSKLWAGALVAPLVILGVWWSVRQIRKHVE
ncbi:MAG: DUF3422 family protein [Planktomarina sp.]